jgi:hypothetical protein
MKHPRKHVRLIVSLTALCLGWVLFHSLGHAQSQPSPAKPKQQVLFEDKFDRDDVGKLYDVLEPDPNRLTINDGKLLIVAATPPKNLVLVQQTFPGDFVATVPMTMRVTRGNRAGLYYWVDEENGLFVGVRGGEGEKIEGKRQKTFRGLIFSKKVDGQENTMQLDTLQLGKRPLKGESPAPELWYLIIVAREVNLTVPALPV